MYSDDYVFINSLVKKVQDNDSDALWELFEFYKPVIFQATLQLTKKFKSIEQNDLISESVFILKDLCLKFNPEKSYFSYFFNSRLKPYLVSKIESRYLEKIDVVALSDVENYESKFDLVSYFEDFIELQTAIENLQKNDQQAIELFYFENYNQAECAKFLKISQPAFNKRLKRALKNLKKYFEQ